MRNRRHESRLGRTEIAGRTLPISDALSRHMFCQMLDADHLDGGTLRRQPHIDARGSSADALEVMSFLEKQPPYSSDRVST